MSAYRVNFSANQTGACGQVGGNPGIPVGDSWPRCNLCNAEMIAFIEVILPETDAGVFKQGSRLQIFACREHDDIAGTIYADYTLFDRIARIEKLPPEYWRTTDGHYLVRLLPPSQAITSTRNESRLVQQFVTLNPAPTESDLGLQLFGSPFWLQDPESHICSCGAPMELLIQIPEGQGFAMAKGAEEQPNSFSATQYCIFLGNQLFLFGCTKQCNPLALWPVLQN